MLTALGLPELLERLLDRRVIVFGAPVLTIGLLLELLATNNYAALVTLWLLLGMGYPLTQIPSGRLLRCSANEQGRSALFVV